jgi:hypothetical protein
MLLAATRQNLIPSRTLPGTLLTYQQASGFEELLGGGGLKIILDEYDKAVYVNVADIRTKVAVGQNFANELPSVNIELHQIQTPTYLMQVAATWNRRDIGSAASWGMDLVQAQRFGMRQGIYQNIRNAALYGNNPALGEGLLNTVGATVMSAIPQDANAHTTVTTIDPGWMAHVLTTIIQALKVRTMQMGRGVKITVCGPQRILSEWEYRIVQLTDYQRIGAGSGTIQAMIEQIAQWNGDTVAFVYDDTLIGKGPNGYDAVIFSMPEVQKPSGYTIDTNEFANVQPGISETVIQLADKTAPSEYMAPMALDSTSMGMEMLVTSGWALRPECLTILGAQYQ